MQTLNLVSTVITIIRINLSRIISRHKTKANFSLQFSLRCRVQCVFIFSTSSLFFRAFSSSSFCISVEQNQSSHENANSFDPNANQVGQNDDKSNDPPKDDEKSAEAKQTRRSERLFQ